MATTRQSADLPATADGTQYHIGLKPGDVAPYILLCGDPGRVQKVASYFQKKKKPITHREYVTVTGVYKGIPISVVGTGIGPDNIEIALVELAQIVKNPTLIRIGTSGGLLKNAELGDLCISSGAVRLENTSTYFVFEGYPAVAHHEVVLALIEAADRKKFRYHVGITATTPGFYGAQGRKIPQFPPRQTDILDQLAQMNVANFEMESSTLFTLSQLAGFRSGSVNTLIDNRHKNVFIDSAEQKRAEKECIEAGLEAFVTLAKMDAQRGKQKHWIPTGF